MKNILIVSIESNAKAYTPAGKEMRLLAKKLAENNQVTLLTTYVNKRERDRGVYGDRLKIDCIKNPNKRFYAFFRRQTKARTAIGECLLRIYYKFFKNIINRTSHKSFYLWMKKHEKQYDVIISVSHPMLNHEYAYQINKRGLAKEWHLFLLDPFSGAYKLDSIEQHRRREKETKYFEQCSKIFTTQPILSSDMELFTAKYKSKTVIIPDVFIYDKTQFNIPTINNEIRVGYFGAFLPKIREPHTLFEMLSFLPKNFIADIYYCGCETIVNNLHRGDNIRVHDVIRDDRKYNETVGKTDILINIGNLNGNQIASKIYDYIGYGKPIIHFYQNDDDYTIMKFSSYPIIKFIDYRSDPQQLSKVFFKACLELKGAAMSYKKIGELFADDTLDSFIEKHYCNQSL